MFLEKYSSHTFNFIVVIPRNVSPIILTLLSLYSINFVLRTPILFAIILFTGISTAAKETPARNEIPIC